MDITKFNEIVDGWKNYIFQNPATEELGKQRLTKCLTCEWRNIVTDRCKLCRCPIQTAVRSRLKRCPANKW